MTLQLLNIDEIIENYELFIFDLWGVIHNGQEPFVNTLKCLARLKQANKLSFLLSNSPRLVQPTIKRLAAMGIAEDLYQGAYTSGLDCHLSLKNRKAPFYKSLGEKIFHIGPDTYLPTFDTLNYTAVPDIDQADFILISGIVDWTEPLEEYDFILEKALNRNLPLVCANADKQVIKGQKRVLCAGMLAEQYLQKGGTVSLHGKPNPLMYQKVHQLAEEFSNHSIDKKNILMIGDSLATDIKGANNYGIDSLMVLTGVHGEDLLPLWSDREKFEKKLFELEETYKSHPTYIISHLE
jgi:HAD superfamily hydrolase (TIGR01459 family)